MVTDDYAALLLELSEFLNHRPSQVTALSNLERFMVRKGLVLLKQVREGYRLLSTQGALAPDLFSLNAFTFATRALPVGYGGVTLHNGQVRQQMIENAIEVLEQIENNESLANMPAEKVKQVRQVLARLAAFAFANTSESVLGPRADWFGVFQIAFESEPVVILR